MADGLVVRAVRTCIDANDVALVTGFWADLFGYRVRETDPADAWRHLEPDGIDMPALTIQPVPERKQVKNRLHLDVFVADPEPWIARAEALGATRLFRSDDPDDLFQVLADPEGNELCFCWP